MYVHELAQSCGNYATDLSAYVTGEHLVGLLSCVQSLNNVLKNKKYYMNV